MDSVLLCITLSRLFTDRLTDMPRRRITPRFPASSRFLSGIVAGLLALAGLSLDAPALAAEPAPIRIGMIEGLSGPLANGGEAVRRNLEWAIERVNARGGVKLPDGQHKLALLTYDNKNNVEDTLVMLRNLVDAGLSFVALGNSSATASALIDAIEKQNSRMPERRVLFLNYSAVDPSLTNEQCSYWHFRFDAHAGMRMHALTEVLRGDRAIKRVYLIGQDYSFGKQVAVTARSQLAAKRPDIEIVGDELHPLGRIKDFAPYVAKIKASGADALITGNWGNDLTLLVKAARDANLTTRFYTFYGNGLGAPAALGEAGVGRVRAVAEWHPNAGSGAGKAESDAFVAAFRKRYPDPREDYQHLRMTVMIEMLASAIEKAGSAEAGAVAAALEGARYSNGFHDAQMRREDHQLLQPLYVSVMDRTGSSDATRFDNEGSGFAFRTERRLSTADTAQPSTCVMKR